MPGRVHFLIPLLLTAACVRPYAGGSGYDSSAGSPSSDSAAAPAPGETLDQQVARLREQVEATHGESEQMVAQLREDVIALNKRMDEIQQQIEQALRPSQGTALPDATPSAGSVQDLQDRLNELTNKYNAVIYVLRERGILTAEPDKGAAPPPAAAPPATPTTPPSGGSDPPPASTAPATPKEWYDRAYEMYKNGKIAEAREQFSALIAAHPDVDLADNAQYWIGECRYSAGEYEAAVGEFAKLIKTYPKSNKVCRATLKIGYAFAELKKKEEAATAFDKVIATCGDSEESRLAKKKKDLLR